MVKPPSGGFFLGNLAESSRSASLSPHISNSEDLSVELTKTMYGSIAVYDGQMGPIQARHPLARRKPPKNWAFLVHPLDYQDVESFSPKLLRFVDRWRQYFVDYGRHPPLLQEILDKLALRAIGKVTVDSRGRLCHGVMLFIPYLPEEFTNLDRKGEILDCLKKAIRVAHEEYAADYVGLGAFTSIASEAGLRLDSDSPIPLTTGNTGAAYGCQLGVEKAACQLGIPLKRSTLTVVGATGSVGVPTCLLLAPKFERIVLCARNESELKRLKKSLIEQVRIKPDRIRVTTDVNEAANQADVIVLAASTTAENQLELNPDMIRPGSVVVDLGRPRNFSSEKAAQAQFLVIDGAILEGHLEFDDEISFRTLRLGGTNELLGCMAETATCALEGEQASSSIGSIRSLEPIKLIVKRMRRYGFRLARLRSNDSPLADARVKEIALIRRERVRAERREGLKRFFGLVRQPATEGA